MQRLIAISLYASFFCGGLMGQYRPVTPGQIGERLVAIVPVLPDTARRAAKPLFVDLAGVTSYKAILSDDGRWALVEVVAKTRKAVLRNGQMYTENRGFNSLLQMTSLTVRDSSNVFVLNQEYRFSATANDGKITSSKNNVSGEEVNYSYDPLGAVVYGFYRGSAVGLAWSFDGFGNRLSQTATKGTAPPHSVLVDPATNRVQSWSYDANGNATFVPGVGSITYDVADRVKTAGGETYGYSADNRRIWKRSEFTFWAGSRVGRYTLSTSGFVKVSTDEYFGSRRLQVLDRLGSNREGGKEYFPYGEERSATGNPADKFATYERDATGLDYADQRYFVASTGRFVSRDPAGYGLNHFAYAGDPINNNDPSGLAVITTADGHCRVETLWGGDGWRYNVFCNTLAGRETAPVQRPVFGTPDFAGAEEAADWVKKFIMPERNQIEFFATLARSIELAVDALENRPGCRALFGSNSNLGFVQQSLAPSAAAVLRTLARAPTFRYVAPPYNDTFAATPVSRVGWDMLTPLGLASAFMLRFGVVSRAENHDNWHLAATVLHELGHVLRILGFEGGAFTHPDGGPGQSAGNTTLINRECFGILPTENP